MNNEMNEEMIIEKKWKWNDKLALTGSDIGKGAIMLSESLKTNTTLTSLNLECDENE